MGVQGLWDLLGVTGRRVEVQALGNKRIAVDASIWVVQVQVETISPTYFCIGLLCMHGKISRQKVLEYGSWCCIRWKRRESWDFVLGLRFPAPAKMPDT